MIPLVVFVMSLPINEIAIPVVEQQNSAKDLGTPISLGASNSLNGNKESSLHLSYQIEREKENPSIVNSANPLLTISAQESSRYLGQVSSVSGVIKLEPLQSTLVLDSQNLQSELSLFAENGLGIKFTGIVPINSNQADLNIEPIFRMSKLVFWLQEQFNGEENKAKNVPRKGVSVNIPRNLNLGMIILPPLENFQPSEIEDSLKNAKSLRNSARSLSGKNFGKGERFFVDADLNNISAEYKFSLPGSLRDELEIKSQANLPAIIINDRDINKDIQINISLRYGIAIDDKTKLEVQNLYDLTSTNNTIYIRFFHKQ